MYPQTRRQQASMIRRYIIWRHNHTHGLPLVVAGLLRRVSRQPGPLPGMLLRRVADG